MSDSEMAASSGVVSATEDFLEGVSELWAEDGVDDGVEGGVEVAQPEEEGHEVPKEQNC